MVNFSNRKAVDTTDNSKGVTKFCKNVSKHHKTWHFKRVKPMRLKTFLLFKLKLLNYHNCLLKVYYFRFIGYKICILVILLLMIKFHLIQLYPTIYRKRIYRKLKINFLICLSTWYGYKVLYNLKIKHGQTARKFKGLSGAVSHNGS